MTKTKETDPKETEKAGAKAKPKAKPGPKPKPHAPSSSSAAAKKPPAQTAQSKKSGGGKGFLWFLVFVVILGGGLTVGWPYIGPYVSDQVRPVVEDMRARLGLSPRQSEVAVEAPMPTPAPEIRPEPIVEAPVEAIVETSVEPVVDVVDPLLDVEAPPALDPDLSPVPEASAPMLDTGLLSRLDDLEGQLGTMSNADGQAALMATKDLADALVAINSRLDALDAALKKMNSKQSMQSANSVSAQALVLAATQLRVRLMDDSAFNVELSALERIAKNDEKVLAAIARLKPHAEVGVPSVADLTARFAGVATNIVRAKSTTGEPGWVGTLKDSLSGLVTVRRTDPNQITDDVDRSIAVAQAALQIGALDEAVAALSPLQGSPGDAVAAWLGDARARLDVESALDTLYNQALAAMAQVGGA